MIIICDKRIDVNDAVISNFKVVYISERDIGKYQDNEKVVAIVGSRRLANRIIKMRFPNLRVYQLTSAGYDGVLLELFRNKGIYVCNTGNVYSVAISEMVLYGILQFAKRYWRSPKIRFIRPFRNYYHITELSNKKMLILGCGSIGEEIAKRSRAFGMEVFGYDIFCFEKSIFNKIYNSKQELIGTLRKYDYIVSTLPANESTKNFFDLSMIRNLGSKCLVVGVGRLSIFDMNELYRALKSHDIQGAVLDMFELVPNPISNKMRRLSNVIVFPGVAAISKEVNIKLSKHIINNMRLIINNEKPKNIV